MFHALTLGEPDGLGAPRRESDELGADEEALADG